jgi:hypothetical protein
MKRHPFVLQSPLVQEEAIRRLRAAIKESGMGMFRIGDWDRSVEFYGEIDGNRIELRKRRSFFSKNDFAPHLFAELIPIASGGTKVEGHFDISSWVSGFMALWMIFAAVVGGIVFVSSLIAILSGHRFGQKGNDAMVGIIVPPALVLLGFLLPRIGYYFHFEQENELLEFLKSTFMASEVSLPA